MSSKIDIKKIDKNFSSNVSNNLSYRWINPLNSSDISVYGFNWFQKDRRYHRFPQDCDKIIEKLDGCVAARGIPCSSSRTRLRFTRKWAGRYPMPV